METTLDGRGLGSDVPGTIAVNPRRGVGRDAKKSPKKSEYRRLGGRLFGKGDVKEDIEEVFSAKVERNCLQQKLGIAGIALVSLECRHASSAEGRCEERQVEVNASDASHLTWV